MAFGGGNIDHLFDLAALGDRKNFAVVRLHGLQLAVRRDGAVESTVWFKVIRTFVSSRVGARGTRAVGASVARFGYIKIMGSYGKRDFAGSSPG